MSQYEDTLAPYTEAAKRRGRRLRAPPALFSPSGGTRGAEWS